MPSNSNFSEIRTSRLGTEKINQAYPLVRELRGDLTLDDWRGHADAYLGAVTRNQANRGIIVAEHRDFIRGLLCYDILVDLRDAATLTVHDVVVLGMPASQPVARSLLQHLFTIAGTHRCGAIRIDLTETMKWLAREWSDPQGELFRFPVICFLPGSSEPVPPGTRWQASETIPATR